ncbi:MAG: helix-turn-helix transcriptional regulator [Spirochaetes bacterium]|nr:helix-turn-helix transcriptional regulator [Spirochaetota bacterium]
MTSHPRSARAQSSRVVSSEKFESFVNRLRFVVTYHGQARLDSRWRGEGHTIASNILFLVKSGSGVYVYNGRPVELLPGKAYLFPKGAVVGFSCPRRLEKFFLHFRLEVNPLVDLFDLLPARPLRRDLEAGLLASIARFTVSDLRAYFSVDAELRGLIARFLEDAPRPDPAKLALLEKYAPIMRHLEAHLGIDLTVGRLAALMGLAEQNLSRRFKKETGMNLKHLVVRKVVERARDELRGSGKKVKEIAEGLRFEDHLYFSKFFKTHTGLSPVEYRRRGAALP